jgi:hypothetical protein
MTSKVRVMQRTPDSLTASGSLIVRDITMRRPFDSFGADECVQP